MVMTITQLNALYQKVQQAQRTAAAYAVRQGTAGYSPVQAKAVTAAVTQAQTQLDTALAGQTPAVQAQFYTNVMQTAQLQKTANTANFNAAQNTAMMDYAKQGFQKVVGTWAYDPKLTPQQNLDASAAYLRKVNDLNMQTKGGLAGATWTAAKQYLALQKQTGLTNPMTQQAQQLNTLYTGQFAPSGFDNFMQNTAPLLVLAAGAALAAPQLMAAASGATAGTTAGMTAAQLAATDPYLAAAAAAGGTGATAATAAAGTAAAAAGTVGDIAAGLQLANPSLTALDALNAAQAYANAGMTAVDLGMGTTVNGAYVASAGTQVLDAATGNMVSVFTPPAGSPLAALQSSGTTLGGLKQAVAAGGTALQSLASATGLSPQTLTTLAGALAPAIANAIDPVKAPTSFGSTNSTGTQTVAGTGTSNQTVAGNQTQNVQGTNFSNMVGRQSQNTTGGSTQNATGTTAQTMQEANTQNTTGATQQVTQTTYSPQEQAIRDAQMAAAQSTYASAVNPTGADAQTMQQMRDAVKYGLTGALDVRNNPYLAEAIQAVLRPVTQNFTDVVLPGIRSDAMQAGQYGGTRQGLGEGIAAGRVVQTMADTAAKLGSDAYTTGQQTFSNTLNNAPSVLSAGWTPLNQYLNATQKLSNGVQTTTGANTSNVQGVNTQNTSGTNTQAQTATNFSNMLGTNTQNQTGGNTSAMTGTNNTTTQGNTTNNLTQNTTNAQTQNATGAAPQTNVVGDALSGMLLANQIFGSMNATPKVV